ncbi:MAG: MFS transporter [Actinomycetota bacterium]
MSDPARDTIPPPGVGGRDTTPSALGQRGFLPLWIGQSLSQLGFQFEGLAMPVIAVTLLNATEAQMGYLGAASTAAFLLVGLLAGGWVDRWRKRRVMIASDVVRAVVVLAIPLLWFAGELEIWQLYLVAGTVGVATVFFDVAYQSFIPVLVDDDVIGDANGKLESTAQVARLGGPAVAGALLKVVSAPVLLVANAVGFAASAASLAIIRDEEVPPPRSDRQGLVAEIRDGLAFVFSQPLLRRVLLTTASSNLASTILFTLMPILVLRILGITPQVLGMVLSVAAVGGLAASVTTTRLARRFGEGQTLRASTILFAASAALLPAAALVPGSAVAMLTASMALQSFGVVTYNIVQVTARQRMCPRRLLGRMNASMRFVVWGVMPLAALLAGWLGTAFGTVPAMWVGVAIGLLSTLPFLTGPFGRMRELPTRP